MANSNFTEVRVVCLGTVLSHNHNKSTGLQLIDEQDKPVGEPAYFGNMKKGFPAAIFTIKGIVVDGNLNTVQPASLTWDKRMTDTEWAAEIRVAHEAGETVLTVARQTKNARRDRSDILDTLKPLRRAWKNTNSDGRLAIELRVLRYLRDGSGL